jgi:hypothetical protein
LFFCLSSWVNKISAGMGPHREGVN